MRRNRWAWACLGAGLLSASCSGGLEPFFIVQNQVPTAECAVSAARDNVYRGKGTLDVGLIGPTTPSAYRMYPLLQNDLPAAGAKGSPEPNRLALRSFRVRLQPSGTVPTEVEDLFRSLSESADGRRLLEYEESWSGSLDPAGGLVAASVTAIPGELARRIRSTGALSKVSHIELLAEVRAVADHTRGSMTSDEFRYPIRICEGCLVARVTECPATPTNKGHACNIAQDEPIDCCTDGASLICPSVMPAAGK